jgi:hypothetical protein
MNRIDRSRLIAFVSLIAILCVQAHAQTNLKLVNRTRFAARIDFECAVSKYPKRRLARVVRVAMKGLDAGDIGVWGNRAVAFDLNKDGKPEYFIPLDCGATGNCNWGIFSLTPQKRLGIFAAKNIYIQRTRHWPILVTYIHGGASEGLISLYKYTGHRYAKTGGDFEVSGPRKDFPQSMEMTHSTCEKNDASKARRTPDTRRSSSHE